MKLYKFKNIPKYIRQILNIKTNWNFISFEKVLLKTKKFQSISLDGVDQSLLPFAIKKYECAMICSTCKTITNCNLCCYWGKKKLRYSFTVSKSHLFQSVEILKNPVKIGNSLPHHGCLIWLFAYYWSNRIF